MNKTINLITVPYDSAHYNERMGAGPLHLINNGLIEKLKSAGLHVNHEQIILEDIFLAENASAFKLLSQVKSCVSKAIKNGSFPVVLSGNCGASVGVVAALSTHDTGIIWLDAHGDCETPDTTVSGFLDGMSLSMLMNKCWQNILHSFGIQSNIPGKHILLVGARDISKYEQKFISINEINHITVEQIKSKKQIIKDTCSGLIKKGIKKIHIHIDADVLDPSVVVANSYAVRNGLSKKELFQTIKVLTDTISISSVTIASYDPLSDVDNRMLLIVEKLIEIIMIQVK